MDEKEFCRHAAMSVADELRRYGFTPAKIKLREATMDGWWTPVASWGKGKPVMGMWFDRVIEPDRSHLWFGFYSADRKAIAELVEIAQPVFGSPVISTVDDADATLSKNIEILRRTKVLSYETEFDEYDYVGKYDVCFEYNNDWSELYRQAAIFLRDVVRCAEPDYEEQFDVEEIEAQADLSETDRNQLIKARKGQGKFRLKLLSRWRGCAVTGCKIEEVLRASHIKPWKKSSNEERLDADNGLLLTATLDALFDRGLISFTDDGEMLVSPRLREEEVPTLLGSENGRLRQALSGKQRQYMEMHRMEIFL